jgi:hypothetical protein
LKIRGEIKRKELKTHGKKEKRIKDKLRLKYADGSVVTIRV